MDSRYLDSYIYYITLERKLAKNTIKMYIDELKKFFNFLNIYFKDKTMIEITEDEEIIKKYIYKLVEQDKNIERTVNRKITILRNFFNYLASTKQFPEIKATPMLNIKNQKPDKSIPIFLTIEECEKFFYGIKFFSRYALRDYAMFQVFLSTGARLSEIAQLEINQIDLQSGTIKLFGKGRKERIVVLTEGAMDALNSYLHNGDNKDLAQRGRVPKVNTDIVFINKYGTPFTSKGIYMLFVSLTKKIGIYKKGLSPHKLRHTFATLLYNNGCDVLELQKILGHSSLTSTQVYTHVLDEDTLNRVRASHPLNKKKIDDDFIKKIKNGK